MEGRARTARSGDPGSGRPAERPQGGPTSRLAWRRRVGGTLRRLEHRAPEAHRGGGVAGGAGSRPGHPLHRATRSVRYGEMTVRMTPTESGTTPRPPDLHPVPGHAPPEVAGVGQSPTSPPNGTDPPSGPAGAVGTDRPWPSPDRPRTDSRRALRDARRKRRRASVVCTVVVAVCLALTIPVSYTHLTLPTKRIV